MGYLDAVLRGILQMALYLFLVIGISKAQTFTSVNDSLLGSRIPGFEVSTMDGKHYNTLELEGKTIVLNFWFIGCAPCLKELPQLNRLREEFARNENIVFLAISVYGTAENMKLFLQKKPFLYEVVVSDFSIPKSMGIREYPTNIIIDSSGKIIFVETGYQEDIEKEMKKVIKDSLQKK